MPHAEVRFHQSEIGSVPVKEWLEALKRRNERAFSKCVARIKRLKEMGHELRRPEADYVGGDLYELRTREGRVNYRILYFFYGQRVCILAHGLTKEDKLPKRDIETAVRRKTEFESAPDIHTFQDVEWI